MDKYVLLQCCLLYINISQGSSYLALISIISNTYKDKQLNPWEILIYYKQYRNNPYFAYGHIYYTYYITVYHI
jgi:hypothetical protein